VQHLFRICFRFAYTLVGILQAKRRRDVARADFPFEEYAELFEQFPNNLDELNDEIARLEQQASLLIQGMAAAMGEDRAEKMVRDFEKRQKALEAAEEKLSLESEQLERLSSDIKRKRVSWMEEVVAMMSQISGHLGAYFQAMGCAAEGLW
jgi:chromosome segregation ATPase